MLAFVGHSGWQTYQVFYHNGDLGDLLALQLFGCFMAELNPDFALVVSLYRPRRFSKRTESCK